jgi:hypothetical protein
MHTQNEQKKSRISHNELINKALYTFALLTDKTDYIKLHIFFTDYILQPVGTKTVNHILHKLPTFEKRERYIYIYTHYLLNHTTHCAEHCAFYIMKKSLRLILLYKYICIICKLCNYLIYLFIFARVIRFTCFVIRCNNLKFYVTCTLFVGEY